MKIRIKAQNGVKISSVFGRTYIRSLKSWSAIKKSVILPINVNSEMFNYFIQNFENSLLLDDKDFINTTNDATLVWAINFYEALKQRQDKRKLEASKRIASDAILAAKEAELSDWEDSDDENYVPKNRDNIEEEENEENLKSGTVVNIQLQKIEEEKKEIEENNNPEQK